MTALHRYRLVRAIATGGMAQVYEAVATGEADFERRVAIKRVLPVYLEDDRQRRMFIDEARIASRLYHSNIVQVLDYGVVDGSEFLVMELVDGIDAARACRQAETKGISFPETVALHIIAEVALALDYAHGREDESGEGMGIVHRDVSPQNLLLSWGGDVKLSDFGIAKAHVRQEKTATGLIKGKEAYMAPEQAAAHEVTAATDIFALGVTLHVLLEGYSPFKYGVPIDTGRKGRGTSKEVKDLIDRCLAADPKERPSASAVAERTNALRSRRTESTGRHELAEWLKNLRDAAPTRDAFNELLSAYLVQQEPGSHVYSITRSSEEIAAAVRDTETAGEDLKDASPSPEAESREGREAVVPVTTAEQRTDKARRPLAIGVLVLLAGALALGGLWWMRSGSARDSSSGRELASVSAPGSVTPSLGLRDAATVSAERSNIDAVPLIPTPEAGPAESPRDAAPPPDSTRDPTHRPRRRPQDESATLPDTRAAASPDDSQPIDPAAKASTAWLRVGGQSLRRAAIEIDGSPVGHAPLERSLKVGSYRLVARDAETREVLLDTRIDLSEHHRRTTPLRIIR